MTTQYFYGAFALNDGVNYFLQQKAFDLPEFKQTQFAIGRLEGVKKTGERLDSKQIPVTVTVVGSSRADLEAKLDALLLALSQRQQTLTLHAADNRYYVADAVAARIPFVPGKIVSVEVAITFVLQQPFAYAASASSNTSAGLVMQALVGQTNVWFLPNASNPITISGGGTYFSRPQLTITNRTTANATTLTAGFASGSPITSLSVAALPAAATAGQVFLLVNGANQIQRVTLAANASLGATTLSVVSFTPANGFSTGNFCGLDIYLQGFMLTQDPDGQVLTVTGLGAQAVGNGTSLIINCDPTQTNGDSVRVNNGAPLSFSGAFPVLDPGLTQFFLQVTCSNAPTLDVQVTWTPRYLA